MTYYEREVKKMRSRLFRNETQLNGIIAIRHYISTHFDTGISLDHLADNGHTSKYHLLRLFKKYYGQTPRQFLTDVRIAKAKIYLASGWSIAATCFAVGFESPSSFSTLFKYRTGRSPIEFQREQFSQRPSARHLGTLNRIKKRNNENTSD